MIVSSSSFVASSIPLFHNGVKNIIFKCAEIFMAVFIYKLFSLIAGRSRLLTSYFMFAEDYIQRYLFLSSRGLTRASIVVLLFSILSTLTSLYGTLLWALDSPGYVLKDSNATVTDYASYQNEDSPYIIVLNLNPRNLEGTTQNLAQIVGADLFKPGLNYTLIGEVDRGTPEVTPPTRQADVGPRIWLDDEGFSVSMDTGAMLPESVDLDGQKFPTDCLFYEKWNCTFSNTFSRQIVETVVGRPEVHWDDASDKKSDSRYVAPNREDNLWFSFGKGGGSAVMSQVFTVTKGKRRHTFFESALRATMLTNPDVPFANEEVDDLVRRSFSRNETERHLPVVDHVILDIMKAQDANMSYYFGVDIAGADNRTVMRSSWALFTVSTAGVDLYSMIVATGIKIALIRTETLDNEVTPFGPCDQGSWQNEAFGGKVTRTDCVGLPFDPTSNKFFGQVDTSAVMLIFGFGDGRSNISAQSLDERAMDFLSNNSRTLMDLLVAKGYIAGVDPALVKITVKKLVAAMSGLQLFLSAFAAVLAAATWLALAVFADAHFNNSLLANLVHTTSRKREGSSRLGYMPSPPKIGLLPRDGQDLITINGQLVALRDASLGLERLEPSGTSGFQTGVCEIPEHEEASGDRLLSHYHSSS